MAYFGKNYHPPGTPPGTLVEHEASDTTALSIRLIDYIGSQYVERQLTNAKECRPYLDQDSITWIHLQGKTQAESMQQIGELFSLHPLAMEDVLNTGQRPKIETYNDQLFIIMAMPSSEHEAISIEQISIFAGHNYVISILTGVNDPFEPLRQRLRKSNGRARKLQADYLLYCILDIIIDQGFPVLEDVGEQIEVIEEALLASTPEQNTLSQIHHLRRELLLLRRNLWPQREVVSNLLQTEQSLIDTTTLIYLRDCYDHIIQIMDLIENYREMSSSLIDIYHSTVSHRLNEIMRVLTMIATIFIPLTFIAGVYGMNFHANSPWAMPELGWYYGYPLILAVMLIIVIGMMVFFRRKHWL